MIVYAAAAANNNHTINITEWCLHLLSERPRLLSAIDIGYTARQPNVTRPEWMPAFNLFTGAFAVDLVGKWLWEHEPSPLHLLRNICVHVNSDKQCKEMLQRLGKLRPSLDRREFGVRFGCETEEISNIEFSMRETLTLLCAKAPALDTLCIMMSTHVTPALFSLFATHLHPTITSFYVQTRGLIKLVLSGSVLKLLNLILRLHVLVKKMNHQCRVCVKQCVKCWSVSPHVKQMNQSCAG